MSDTTPRIYVACLTSYNAGRLVGEWIDATLPEDELITAVQQMLAGRGEEWAIHDHEGFCGAKVGEYMSLSEVSELAAFIVKHGSAGAAWLNYFGEEPDDDKFADSYRGTYRDAETWAEEYLEETGMLSSVPENLRCYFDMEKFARDCNYSGDVTFVDCDEGVHVFDCH